MSTPQPTIQYGPVTYDPNAHSLLRSDGKPLKIRPKSLSVFLALLSELNSPNFPSEF